MAADDENCCYLQKFKLYETRSNFYMIGTDKSKAVWRVLTIDRLEPLELHIREDSTRYSADECQDLLTRIHEGNKSTGGLKFITNCYGIVGFVKFLGPYYLLIITQRKKIGTICGHSVYAVGKSEMIVLPSSKPWFSLSNSKSESRYKKLLCAMDLTKDFYFSYSYHIMRSLQKNLCNRQSGHVVYETMFVWNEFLTHEIRHHLKSSIWTVALVYGFFKQVKLSVAGKDFNLTLIARRSRYFAGTRYLKRGVNEKGRVANDVETEQIVFENIPASISTQITSVVQNRGSIPLFWSQESSRLNLKPDIILHNKDRNYQATKLHFENLAKRYGNPIIIFNLIKTNERKPRESILRAEFIKAIDAINAQLTEENRLRFLHLDLNRYSRSKTTDVLDMLGKVTNFAMPFTGFFHCQLSLDFKIEELPAPKKCKNSDCSCVDNKQCGLENIDTLRELKYSSESDCCFFNKTYSVQKGVLRTNCIDCLDRTNVAQYAYGLSALAHQLHVLHLLDVPKIDLDSPLADDLMNLYEEMGDTLALQYGGSAAHNKIFCERRGQWPAATQSQELFRALQRYYSNAYVDPEKQDAINVFLGYFQPQQGKPALWELDSDQHFNVGKPWNGMLAGNSRLSFKRSFSEGSILSEDNTIISDVSEEVRKHSDSLNGKKDQAQDSKNLLEFTPDVSPYDCNVSRARYVPGMACQQLFVDQNHISINEHGTYGSSSNFLDLDWLSSSGNSCDESSLLCSPIETRSRESLVDDTTTVDGGSSLRDITATPNDKDLTQTDSRDTVQDVSERFKQWVLTAVTLCY